MHKNKQNPTIINLADGSVIIGIIEHEGPNTLNVDSPMRIFHDESGKVYLMKYNIFSNSSLTEYRKEAIISSYQPNLEFVGLYSKALQTAKLREAFNLNEATLRESDLALIEKTVTNRTIH